MTLITGSYSSFSVIDLSDTRAFYRDILGLDTSERDRVLLAGLPTPRPPES